MMEEESHLAFRGVQGEILFVLLTILYFVVARFLAVVSHEILGHGLVSEIIGGEFYAVYVSPGPGFTAAYIPEATPLAPHVLYLMAGIIAEVILGLIVLYLIYPRLKSFFLRLFALLLLEVLLIHSLTYMFLGSLYGEGGDSMQVIQTLPGVDHFWAIRFVATGLLFTVAFAYVITTKALELLREHFKLRTRRAALRILLLFWLPHLLVGYLAGLVGYGMVSNMVINYLVLFVSVTVLIFLFASLYVSRKPLLRPDVMTVGRNGIFATLVAFLLVLSVWFLAFGIAPSTAHGVLLREPPAQEEIRYTESYAVNLRVIIDEDFNIRVEVRMKAFGDVTSPLEEAIWETFDERPYWSTYLSLGTFVAKEALNYTGWSEINHSVGAQVHGCGEVWSNGKLMSLRFTNANVSLFQDRNGLKVLRVYDVWKEDFGRGNEYLDALNITWHESITLEEWPLGGGLEPVGDPPYTDHISWVFSSFEEAHILYELKFSS
jgi:hypothetical protein